MRSELNHDSSFEKQEPMPLPGAPEGLVQPRSARGLRRAGLVAGLGLIACLTPETTDRGAVRTVDASQRMFHSNRDCGYSTKLSAVVDGQTVTRYLWVFCDSAGWDSEGRALAQGYGYPSNSAAFSDGGAEPNDLPALTSFFYEDASGTPTAFRPLIEYASAQTAPSPQCPPGDLPSKWPSGIATLPDNEPGKETVLVFYQNICVNLGAGVQNYSLLGDTGVAYYQWDATDPTKRDARPVATILTDHLFPASHTLDMSSGIKSNVYGYGQGAVLHTDPADATQYLYTYLCGKNADCSVARVPVSSQRAGVDNAIAGAVANNWRYLDAAGSWTAFPRSPSTGLIPCAPSSVDGCGGATAKAVTTAISGNGPAQLITQPVAGVSVVSTRGIFVLTYGPNAYYSASSEQGVVRMAPAPEGPWGDIATVKYPEAYCGAGTPGCRVPIFHPELSTASNNLGFTYYSEADLSRQLGWTESQGRLRWAQVCLSAFNTAGATCTP